MAAATTHNATDILQAASGHFHGVGMPFKFLRNGDVLNRLVSKDADRASSGKFIAAYPDSEAALQQTLVELDAMIGG